MLRTVTGACHGRGAPRIFCSASLEEMYTSTETCLFHNISIGLPDTQSHCLSIRWAVLQHNNEFPRTVGVEDPSHHDFNSANKCYTCLVARVNTGPVQKTRRGCDKYRDRCRSGLLTLSFWSPGLFRKKSTEECCGALPPPLPIWTTPTVWSYGLCYG